MFENRINIVGLLAEKSLNLYTSKNGMPYIAGTVKIQTEKDNIQTVRVFANKNKKDGSPSTAFAMLNGLMESGISLASSGNDETRVTKVSAGLCQLVENVFVSPRNGQVITRPQINANFLNSRNIMETPKATFSIEIAILSMEEEIDFNMGDPTERLIVRGVFPQYGGRMGKHDFIIAEPANISYVRSHWKENDTVMVRGKIITRVTEHTREKEIEGGFGEPEKEVFTRVKNEYIIISGSDPYETELAFSEEAIREGLKARQSYIDSLTEAKVDESDTDF